MQTIQVKEEDIVELYSGRRKEYRVYVAQHRFLPVAYTSLSANKRNAVFTLKNAIVQKLANNSDYARRQIFKEALELGLPMGSMSHELINEDDWSFISSTLEKPEEYVNFLRHFKHECDEKGILLLNSRIRTVPSRVAAEANKRRMLMVLKRKTTE